MYQNQHGRFTAIDPLLASGKSANPQTFNRYVYTVNRPLRMTDPTGLQSGKAPNLMRCRRDCEASYNKSTNTVSGNSGSLIDLVVESMRETIESIKDFYEPGIQQIVQMRDTGGTPDETEKVIGNQGFTRRQFFDASNRQMGETGQLLLDTLTFIDPTGQASLPQTTYNWENGSASNAQMGISLLGALAGPISLGSGKGVSVIGPRDTYVDFAKSIGANFLDLGGKPWSRELNLEFLKGIVTRGDDVRFAGRMDPARLQPGTALADEIEYLIKNGYSWNDDFTWLTKK